MVDNVTRAIETGEIKISDLQNDVEMFICCSSFEKRSSFFLEKFSGKFRTRFSIVFVIEEPEYEEQIEKSFSIIGKKLESTTDRKIFTIFCLRDKPDDGISQLRQILADCKVKTAENPVVTIDISSFTKVYLLEILYHLYFEFGMRDFNIIYTSQTYKCCPLTEGSREIKVLPHFDEPLSLMKGVLLIEFLGFDPERTLYMWEHYYPLRTILIKSYPESNLKYLRYVEHLNWYILSRPGVESRALLFPYDIYAAQHFLKNIYDEVCKQSKSETMPYNIIIAPFGPKPQAVGLFLFWLNHRETEISYVFPRQYRKTYLKRKPDRVFYCRIRL